MERFYLAVNRDATLLEHAVQLGNYDVLRHDSCWTRYHGSNVFVWIAYQEPHCIASMRQH
jgi:hypothetical protein